MGILYKIVREPLKPPDRVNRSIPPALSKYICLLLQKDPEKRIASANQALMILNRLLSPVETRQRPKKPVTLIALCAVLLVASVGVLVHSVWLNSVAETALPELEAQSPPKEDAAEATPPQEAREPPGEEDALIEDESIEDALIDEEEARQSGHEERGPERLVPRG